MTLKEAKKILKKEGFVLFLASKVINQTGAIREFEKPEVCEAIKVANANRWTIGLTPIEWDKREARLKEEYEKNTKAPGPGEEQPKKGNPALKEAASQFNDALLDEQAKKIARLKKIIHKKNLKIEEFRKESSRHLRGKMKMFGENMDLEGKLKDKDAVLSDVAEELRLTKIREKNLTELCQKYMKENEELKKELADKVVDKIDAQALKSAESALACKEQLIYYKDKIIANNKKKIAEKDEVIADLGKELAATKKQLEGKTKLVEIIRNGSKEYCDYGVAANEFIKKLAGLYILANNTGIINDEMLERCKNYRTYGFPANCNRETKKEIDDIASGKTKAVGVDKAEEGADQSGKIVLCGNGITFSKEEAKIIERCTKNGIELHYSEKNGLTYTNVYGEEMPISCLRGMFHVFTDEEIRNLKK